MATTQFHDVYHGQGDYVPYGPLFAKATQGSSYTDPKYTQNRDRTLTKKLPFCAYHYDDTSDYKAQAAHAFSVIGRDIAAMWDVERGGGTLNNVINIHDAYADLGGFARVLYLPQWYWEQLGRPSLAPAIKRGLLLTSSHYVSSYSDSGPGWAGYGGMVPTFWQWSSTPIDCDAFKGTIAQMAPLLARTPTPPPPKIPYVRNGSRTLQPTTPVMFGTDVEYVQGLVGVARDGRDGPDTTAAIRLWQHRRGLAVDGKFGPQCWAHVGVKYTGK